MTKKKVEALSKDTSSSKRPVGSAKGTVTKNKLKNGAIFIDGNDRISLLQYSDETYHYNGCDEAISKELFQELMRMYDFQSYTSADAKNANEVSFDAPISTVSDDDSLTYEDKIADGSCIESEILAKEAAMDIDEFTRRLQAKLSTSDFRIWTYTYEGLSTREIEKRTGVPNSTVSYRLKKIRCIAKDIARDMGLI